MVATEISPLHIQTDITVPDAAALTTKISGVIGSRIKAGLFGYIEGQPATNLQRSTFQVGNNRIGRKAHSLIGGKILPQIGFQLWTQLTDRCVLGTLQSHTDAPRPGIIGIEGNRRVPVRLIIQRKALPDKLRLWLQCPAFA